MFSLKTKIQCSSFQSLAPLAQYPETLQIRLYFFTEDVRIALRQVFLAMLKRPTTYQKLTSVGSDDQALLERYIWPLFGPLALQHDSYTCTQFAKSHPWPSRREVTPNNFVGAPVALNSTLKDPCPAKCRPREHKDWTFC